MVLRPATAVVGNIEGQRPGFPPKIDERFRSGPSVLGDVRQRLLHHAVRSVAHTDVKLSSTLANAAIAIGADPTTPDMPSGQESLDALERMAANPAAQAAISIEFLAFTAWMAFIGYVCWRLRAAGWVAAVALVGGVVEIAVKLGSAAPLIAGYSLRDQISPEQAAVLTQMNKADFMVGMLPAGLFVLCAAIATLRTKELGRVLAWSGISSEPAISSLRRSLALIFRSPASRRRSC